MPSKRNKGARRTAAHKAKLRKAKLRNARKLKKKANGRLGYS